jgi:hypothetical protein
VTRLKWKLVSIRLEIVLTLIQDRCTVCAERTISSESFWMHPVELLGDVGHVESRFGPFEIVLVSVQDKSIVCTKCTIASETVLDAPDGTPR